jgi:hypothetical protein
LWIRSEAPDLEQFQAESLDLRENAEQGGPVFKPTREHGLAGHQL